MIIARILGSALMLTAAVPNTTAPDPASTVAVAGSDQAQPAPVQDKTLRCNSHCGWDVFHMLH
jgi:hypothetical protein